MVRLVASVLVPYVVDILWSVLTTEIKSEVLIKINCKCASTIGNVHVAEYVDHRDTVQNSY